MQQLVELVKDMREKKDMISGKVEGVEKTFLQARLCEVTVNGAQRATILQRKLFFKLKFVGFYLDFQY